MPRRGPVVCPVCDSHTVKAARPRGFRERLLTLFGYQAAHCLACHHYFLALPTGGWGNVTYARCPRCLRMDLSTWDPKYYRTSRWSALKLWFGASRWRCEPCRHNFVSFRPRREKYVRPGATPPNPETVESLAETQRRPGAA